MNSIPEAIIPLSTRTWQWLKQGKPAGLGLRYRWTYEWHAYWFGVNDRMQRRRLQDVKPNSLVDPVFVLGMWRSGTTLAHELLSCCPGLFAPTTRQCMNASSFAIWHSVNSGSTVTRPMDKMKINGDSPQEDEFALLALGVPTVYRAFLDPSRLEELEELLSPDYWSNAAPPTWTEDFLRFLHLVIQQAPLGQRLVVKSPGHSFRVKAIKQIFPESRYIWITRSPDEMLYSNRKMWRSMFKRYGLSECSTEKLDRFLLRAFVEAANCLDWLCQQVGRDKLAVIDFSLLTTDPINIMAAAGVCLGLGEEVELKKSYEEAMSNRLEYQREHYQSQALPAEAKRVFKMLVESQRRARATHGMDFD